MSSVPDVTNGSSISFFPKRCLVVVTSNHFVLFVETIRGPIFFFTVITVPFFILVLNRARSIRFLLFDFFMGLIFVCVLLKEN